MKWLVSLLVSIFILFVGSDIWDANWSEAALRIFKNERTEMNTEFCDSEALNRMRGDFVVSCYEYPFRPKKWTVNFFTGQIISWGSHQ